jgi:hypothetical protein
VPPVIFRVEQEVSADDCDANRDCAQNGEDQENKSIDVVDLVRPK